MISIVVPCYNEEQVLPIFYKSIMSVVCDMGDYELLFIDDGSLDQTLAKIEAFSEKNEHVRYLSFSRNFGKEAALYAGLCNAKGNYVAVMDADMQDPPTLLPEMQKILLTGEWDCVATKRTTRKGEPVVRSWFSKKFYKFMGKYSDSNVVDGARDFCMMKREVVDAVIMMCERNRFTKGIFGWVGFRTYWISYENFERVAGNTKWSFNKLFRYAIDGIVNFSSMPLNVSLWIGVPMTIISFVALMYWIIHGLVQSATLMSWPLIAILIVFIGGIQLISVGIMGQYVSRMYSEVKHRPHFIVVKSNGADDIKIK